MPDANITITITGDVVDPVKLRAGMQAGLTRGILYLEGKVKDNITPFTKTGRLRSSVTHTQPFGLSARVIVGGTNVKYAKYVEEGTRPHIIRPKNAKALRFSKAIQGPVQLGRSTKKGLGGQVFFAKEVHHPGTTGHFYARDALRGSRGDIAKIIGAEIRKALLG